MKKLLLSLLSTAICLSLLGCSGENAATDTAGKAATSEASSKTSQDSAEPLGGETSNKLNTGNYTACAGVDEASFRSIFEVPDSYKLQDASQFNVSQMTCVMLGSDDNGKQLALIIQMMSTPATYDVISAGFKRDFAKADPGLKIDGLGEAALWVEQDEGKVSGITVVGSDHAVSVLFDHFNTRSREELQPMIEQFYKHWLEQQT